MERQMFRFFLGVSFGSSSTMTGFVPGASTVHGPPNLLEDVRAPGLRSAKIPLTDPWVPRWSIRATGLPHLHLNVSTHSAASLMLVFCGQLSNSPLPIPITDFYHFLSLPVWDDVWSPVSRVGSTQRSKKSILLPSFEICPIR
jgi:hypothetical protein